MEYIGARVAGVVDRIAGDGATAYVARLCCSGQCRGIFALPRDEPEDHTSHKGMMPP